MTTFSEKSRIYSDGQQNVVPIPESILEYGFIPETKDARGQPLPAQWLNWLFQKIFRLINRDIVTDGNGAGLFKIPNSYIRLEAVDKSDPSKFIIAVGWKGAKDEKHSLHVVNSNTLTLGESNETGDQPVLGSDNIVVIGISRQIGEI